MVKHRIQKKPAIWEKIKWNLEKMKTGQVNIAGQIVQVICCGFSALTVKYEDAT